MAKTGWKSGISNTSSAGKTNRTPKGNASSKLTQGRRRDKQPGSERSAETIQRLKMYSNGKAIRNKAGKIVAGTFMMQDRAGDRKIEASTGRIQPDRRWFGNTRVVGATELDRFRQEMTEKVADPYSVVLKRKKLPMGLLQDAAEYKAGNQKAALLEQEPFDQAFGKNSRRKRVKLDQLFVQRAAESADSKEDIKTGEGEAIVVLSNTEHEPSAYSSLLETAQKSQGTYQQVNTREGIVPWGRDSHLERSEGEGIDWRHEKKDDLFLKGQSKRIWGEFFKVVDCSDVVLHIIDARNVPGTRCTMIERHIAKNASHKHLVFVLNKIDLVPNWVAKRWMGELAAVRPTIAFHASLTNAFGKGALISLLRQFGKLHEDKKQISVGVIGYPNVGKSSVINTLISKKSCKVAPIPGETKIWQYVTLFKRISLIDCPGVVVDTAGDTEEDSVLKGVVRAERLENPEDFIDAIMGKVKREHIAAQYKLPKDGEETWSSSGELMEMIARRSGRLLKGGDPCIRTAALMIINDFQRGRLPHFIPPPELKVEEDQKIVATEQAIQIEEQNLDDVVVVEKEMEQDEEGVETKTNDHAAIADTETVIDTSSILIGDGKWDE
jgi:nuclear GTP-binding protein